MTVRATRSLNARAPVCRPEPVERLGAASCLSFFFSSAACWHLFPPGAGFPVGCPLAGSALHQNPGMTRQELAGALMIAGPSVTRQMENLIDDGIVENRSPGRSNHYYLTAEAARALEKVMGQARPVVPSVAEAALFSVPAG